MTLAAASLPATADDGAASWFAQVGAGDHRVSSLTVGATRSFRSEDARERSRWDYLGEFSIGRWNLRPDDPDARRHATQVGLTPIVRYRFGDRRDWFVEAGVGVNVITPIVHSDDKRFSTTFNFGDHVGIGRRFGSGDENEIALRVQHYSNAGIRQPNPGVDFAQLRFSHRF